MLFDEPVNGLDPEGILWIRGFVQGLAAEGRTVLVSSHLLSEMAQMAADMDTGGKPEPPRVIRGKIGVAFQDVEHLDQDHAPGGGWRHREDIVAAIAAPYRCMLDHPIVLEIVARHQAACGAHGGNDLLGVLGGDGDRFGAAGDWNP